MTVEENNSNKSDKITQIKFYEEIRKKNPQKLERMVMNYAKLLFRVPVAALIVLSFLIVTPFLLIWFEKFDYAFPLVFLVSIAVIFWLIIFNSLLRLRYSPEGLIVTRDDCPELFQKLDSVSEKLESPKLTNVYLEGDLNASVLQRNRFGMFGRQENYLSLGLPLLYVLSEEEFLAVIAHEFSHLSLQHGRSHMFIYRAQKMWSNIIEDMEASHDGDLFESLAHWLVKKYVPKLEAMSFPLSREYEYQADRDAAKNYGGQVLADALIKSSLAYFYCQENVEPLIYRAIAKSSDKSIRYQELLEDSLKNLQQWNKSGKTLNLIKSIETDYEDTHPCLVERVEAIGGVVRIPEQSGVMATALLGGHLKGTQETLNKEVTQSLSEEWDELQGGLQQKFSELKKLDEAAKNGKLHEFETLSRAYLSGDLISQNAKIKRLIEAARLFPKNKFFELLTGIALLEIGDRRGMAMIRKPYFNRPIFRLVKLNALNHYYLLSGQHEKSTSLDKIIEKEEEKYQSLTKPIKKIQYRDELMAHDLKADHVDFIENNIPSRETIMKINIGKKCHETDQSIYCYHVFVFTNSIAYCDAPAIREFMDNLPLGIPIETHVFNNSNRLYLKVSRSLENGIIFSENPAVLEKAA